MKKKPKRKLSKKQLAAARKNIKKAQRARFKVKRVALVRRRKGRSTKRKVLTTRETPRKSAKRVAAGKKAARTRARNAAPAKKKVRKRIRMRIGKRTYICKPRRRLTEKQRVARAMSKANQRTGGSVYERPRRRKSPKRVAAGKKAARTRKRSRKNPLPNPIRRRRGKRRARKNPINPIRRRRRSSRRHYMRNPLPNPISGPMEFITGVLSVGFGYLWADGIDRFAATHALTTVNGVTMDAPAKGQIYDAEAPQLPIWSDWHRLAYAVGAIAVPSLGAAMFKGGARNFLQLTALGALVRTAGKAMEDAVATFAGKQPIVQQLYAPEIAAANRLGALQLSTPASVTYGGFAGVPQLPFAGSRRYVGDISNPVGNSGIVITDPVADRGSFAAGSGQLTSSPFAGSCGSCGSSNGCGCSSEDFWANFNPLCAGLPKPDANSFPMPLNPPPIVAMPPTPVVVSTPSPPQTVIVSPPTQPTFVAPPPAAYSPPPAVVVSTPAPPAQTVVVAPPPAPSPPVYVPR